MLGIILGTRPELIKLFPLIKKLKQTKLNFKIIHTGQHYSKNLNEIILNSFKGIKIDYSLKSGSHPHASQVSIMMQSIEKILKKENFNKIIVYGDTNSALAGALACSKIKKIKLIHIEAGLRSFENKMPEEINRIIIDHISDYLFAPTLLAKKFLLKENINKNKIFHTGNLICDSINLVKPIIKKLCTYEKFNTKKNNYILCTFHREENLKDNNRLKKIVTIMEKLSQFFQLRVILPCHPHTKKILKKNQIKTSKRIILIDPLDYFNFTCLLYNSKLIVSDSGGIQEECCILKKKMITIRTSTERQETLKVGGNILIDVGSFDLQKVKNLMKKKVIWKNPYGNFDISLNMVARLKKIK